MLNVTLGMRLPLLADAGTPLMWATLFHLVIGNFFIGILEALIVRAFFKVKGRSLFVRLIVANYASSIAGMVLISVGSDQLTRWVGGPLPVYHVYRILIALALLSFLVTILVEWPFYWLAFAPQAARWKRSLDATLVANAASYFLLVAWYWLASATPVGWGVRLVRPQEMSPNPYARVLYITPQGGDVFQLRLDGSAPRKFISLSKPSPEGVLGFSRQEKNGQWRLELQSEFDQPPTFVADVGPCQATTRDAGNYGWFFPWPASDLQNETSPKWTVRAGFEAREGISALNNRTGDWHFIMAVEAPWMTWLVRSATVLPNDQLIFQLDDQIIWVDLSRNIAAAVAAGHGPVVVLDKGALTPSTAP
jgi:hypothetical protein